MPSNKKEKKILIQSFLAIIISIAAMIAAQIIILNITEKKYICVFPDAADSYASINFDNENVVKIADIQESGNDLIVTLEPVSKGEAFLDLADAKGDSLFCCNLQVDAGGIITNGANGDFTGSDTVLLCFTLFTLALAVIMWVNFSRAIQNLYFSYQAMFYGGFGIWVSVMAVTQVVFTASTLTDAERFSVMSYHVPEYFSNISGAGMSLMLLLTPLLLIFAIFMIISNISLMKHESRRPVNALGMALGILMAAAEVIIILLRNRDMSGSASEITAWNIFTNSLSCLFSVAECLLIGAIICGIHAALHEPEYDRDFVIILGCSIKKDGTLYPLVRGRVDRAIDFRRMQLEKTGKKAILVPSGGKGSDETLSEGEAMKRYILEQGIPEEDVIAETKSRNTLENMKFSAELIKEKMPDAKIAFSTTNFHVFRSGILSLKAGLTADGMGSDTKWYFWPNAFIREFFGLVSYCRKKVILLSGCIIVLFMVIEILIIK